MDEVKASLILLEAKHREIEAKLKVENDRLRADLYALKNESHEEIMELQREINDLKAESASAPLCKVFHL